MYSFKIGKIFVALSCTELHNLFVEAQEKKPLLRGTAHAQAASPSGQTAAEMQAQMAAMQAQLKQAQEQAAAHQAELHAQKQQHQAEIDDHKAKAQAAENQAATANLMGALAANGGLPSIPGAEHITGKVGDLIGKTTGGVVDGAKAFGNLQAAALNHGVELNPTEMLRNVPAGLTNGLARIANQAPAMLSGAATLPQVVKNMDLSETFGKDGQAQLRTALKYANADTLKDAHKHIENLDPTKIDLSQIGSVIGEEDAKDLNDAFQHEKKIFQKDGVKGVMNQIREELVDPQALPLEDYAHELHDQVAAFGINFDESRIQDAIAGFKKVDLDSVAEQVKEKALNSENLKKVLHQHVDKVQEFTKDGIPGMWQKLRNGGHKNAGDMLASVGNGDAESGLKNILEQHRWEVHMSKLTEFYNDSWDHLMMNCVALFILLGCLVFLYKKYRRMLKERRKQMV